MRRRRVKLGWAVVLLDPATLERAKTALGATGTSEAIHHALTLVAERPLRGSAAGARAPASASRASAGA